MSDDGTSEGEEESALPSHQYSFPELDAKIRAVVKEYGGIFPKLNWTSPRVRCIPSRIRVVLRRELDLHRTLIGFSRPRIR